MNKLLTPYKNGIYKALFYGHCLELENGDQLETDIGVRCSRIACGGWKTYKIENNTFEEIDNFADNNCTDENIKLKISGNIVGEATIRDYHDGEKFLCNYEIFPEYRGKGYASKCLDYMVKNKGVNSLSVTVNNDRAIHIYKKYGFEIVGEPYDDGNGEELSYYMKLQTNFTEKLSETKLMKDNIREIFTNDSLYESELKNKYRKRDIRKNYFDKIYDSLTNSDKENDIITGVDIRLRKLSNKLKAIKASDFDKQQIEKLFLDLDESNQILSESIPGEPKTSDYYNNFSDLIKRLNKIVKN